MLVYLSVLCVVALCLCLLSARILLQQSPPSKVRITPPPGPKVLQCQAVRRGSPRLETLSTTLTVHPTSLIVQQHQAERPDDQQLEIMPMVLILQSPQRSIALETKQTRYRAIKSHVQGFPLCSLLESYAQVFSCVARWEVTYSGFPFV